MITYKDSGVNKEEGYKSVDLIKDMAKATHGKNVLTGLGGFGAMFELGKYENPVLISGTDGVGTKLEIAFKTNTYDTVGIDCVAMCVNDILCHGAKPLFFLDYLACGKLEAEVSSQIVSGVAKGCLDSGAALVGGETAEMPGFYKPGDYDIAGFTVGVVEKDDIISGDKVEVGDTIIAIASSGVHSNGFSLVRKLVTDYDEEFQGKKISETLLTPTKLYVKPVLKLIESYDIHGMAHITGGGLIENVPRTLPAGLEAHVEKSKIEVLDIFKFLQEKGVPEEEMWGTFNMGVGFILIARPELSKDIIADLEAMGERAYEIGTIKKGDNGICLK